MAQQHQAKKIGLFTIGAIVLLVVGILVFGSGDFFRSEEKIEMVFLGSVKGLTKGSSITFRGVAIGYVESVDIVFIEAQNDIAVKVIGVLVERSATKDLASLVGSNRTAFEDVMKSGLRAQLVPESLVTGRLQVQFEIYPDRQGYEIESEDGLMTVPTIPTEFEVITETIDKLVEGLKEIPVKEMVQSINHITQGVDSLVNSPQTQALLKDSAESARHLRDILAELDQQKEVITEDVQQTTQSIRAMADSITNVADSTLPVVKSANRSLGHLDALLKQASGTLASYEKVVQPGSELSVAIIQTLQSFDRTSEQVRQLAATLQRNPESILTGKQR